MMRGSFVYFYQRDFRKALKDYIEAYRLSKKQNDSNPYRIQAISYHIV
ncbi:hypothetical protein BPO_p0082 (plasmid) [Bergeyella porcorum]|uniref:Tetratricopeptide repeat protein n=1 Tax=Bergeyella porcorum TaxID=1735111 RepID=A0AAU0F8M3_9FLAO